MLHVFPVALKGNIFSNHLVVFIDNIRYHIENISKSFVLHQTTPINQQDNEPGKQ